MATAPLIVQPAIRSTYTSFESSITITSPATHPKERTEHKGIISYLCTTIRPLLVFLRRSSSFDAARWDAPRPRFLARVVRGVSRFCWQGWHVQKKGHLPQLPGGVPTGVTPCWFFGCGLGRAVFFAVDIKTDPPGPLALSFSAHCRANEPVEAPAPLVSSPQKSTAPARLPYSAMFLPTDHSNT